MARRVLKEVRSVYGKDKWTKAVIKGKLVFLAQASNTRWFPFFRFLQYYSTFRVSVY